MLFNSLEFKSMESSISALWQKQQVISHNLSNQDTPNFKAKKLTFQDVLENNRREGDTAYQFQATISQDNSTKTRPDGNNVDIEKENLELMDTYYQSLALYQKISGQFTNMRSVLSQASFK